MWKTDEGDLKLTSSVSQRERMEEMHYSRVGKYQCTFSRTDEEQ